MINTATPAPIIPPTRAPVAVPSPSDESPGPWPLADEVEVGELELMAQQGCCDFVDVTSSFVPARVELAAKLVLAGAGVEFKPKAPSLLSASLSSSSLASALFTCLGTFEWLELSEHDLGIGVSWRRRPIASGQRVECGRKSINFPKSIQVCLPPVLMGLVVTNLGM